MPFLDDFLNITEEAESPRSFFTWAGLAAISAVMRRNVWVNKRLYRCYPNLYIMFVANSGLRKGFPVKMAQKMVEKSETIKVISGQNSIQSIITELSKQWTSESGKIFRDAQAFIVNDELDALLISDPSAQTLLTTLYDSYLQDKWVKTIKKEGREVLDNLCITLLTATNEDHLESFLDKTSYKGGYLGRTLVVHETKLARINPLIGFDDEETEIDINPLIDYLKKLGEVKGRFSFTKEAVEFYIPWYNEHMQKIQDKEIKDATGTAPRCGDTVLKLSMCISLNESPELLIEEEHIKAAVDLYYRSLGDITKLVEGRGKSEMADKNRIVMSYLLSKPNYTTSRKQLLSARYGDIDSNELDRVIETLRGGDIIEVKPDRDGDMIYSITPRYVKLFREAEASRVRT